MEITQHDEKDLKPCTASELFPGAIFWIKQDNGEYHKAEVHVHPSWINAAYREGLKNLSKQGRLFTRRDKPFQQFWR